jgi:8-oxo-dGTP pyrophosphatase MutT (NUDIX family)
VRGDHDLNPESVAPTALIPAAVLIPIVDRRPDLTVVLTRRTDHLANHAGQVSFPGGHVEPGDRTPEDAALRETEEEIGLDRRHVTVLGRLDDYITRTGFKVTPVVSVVDPPFELDPDAGEVEEVFEVPLAFLLDPANHQRSSRMFDGQRRHYYAMRWGRHEIWGATAGMVINLHEFLTRP